MHFIRNILNDNKAATAIEYGLIGFDRGRRDYRHVQPGWQAEDHL